MRTSRCLVSLSMLLLVSIACDAGTSGTPDAPDPEGCAPTFGVDGRDTFCENADGAAGNVLDSCGAVVAVCEGEDPLCFVAPLTSAELGGSRSYCGHVGLDGDRCASEETDAPPCSEGTTCVDYYGEPDMAVCHAPRAKGEICDDGLAELPCAAELICYYDDKTGLCGTEEDCVEAGKC